MRADATKSAKARTSVAPCGIAGQIRQDLRRPVRNGARPLEQLAVGALQCLDGLRGKTPPPQANQVQALEAGPITHAQAERRNICVDGAQCPHHCVRANAAELMDAAHGAHDHVIAEHDMAAEPDAVGENDLVPDDAVMRHVDSDHHEAAGADPRDTAAATGARMNRRMLADHGLGADDELGVLAPVFEILGNLADRCEGEDPHPRADHRPSPQMYMGPDPGAGPDLDLWPDHRESADRSTVADPCPSLDYRRRVYVPFGPRAHGRFGANMTVKSASATRVPATIAVPARRQTRCRAFSTRTCSSTWVPGSMGRRNLARSTDMK